MRIKKMKSKIKKYKKYIIKKTLEIMNLSPHEQFYNNESRYILSCFFTIGNLEDFKILNCIPDDSELDGFKRHGLYFNSNFIYLIFNKDKYIKNIKYFKKYLKGNKDDNDN